MGRGTEVPVFSPVIANAEIREVNLNIAHTMTTQVNREIGPRMNATDNTMTY